MTAMLIMIGFAALLYVEHRRAKNDYLPYVAGVLTAGGWIVVFACYGMCEQNTVIFAVFMGILAAIVRGILVWP